MARTKRPNNSVPETEQTESGSNAQGQDRQVTQTESKSDVDKSGSSSSDAEENAQSEKQAKFKGKRPSVSERERKRSKSMNEMFNVGRAKGNVVGKGNKSETATNARSGTRMYAGRKVKAFAVESSNSPGLVKKQQKDVSQDLEPDSEDKCKGFIGEIYWRRNDDDSDDRDGTGGGGEACKIHLNEEYNEC